MKLILRGLSAFLVAALVPLTCPAQALAESKTTRSVQVTATVPVMIQVSPEATLRGAERPVVTNRGSSLTQEWRLSPEGRSVRLYTSVVR